MQQFITRPINAPPPVLSPNVRPLFACYDPADGGVIEYFPWDEQLVGTSPVCARLAKVIGPTDTFSMVINPELITAPTPVIFFPEPREFLQPGYIGTIQDFLEYIKFADRYALNIPYICTQYDKIMWLVELREAQLAKWATATALLSPIEAKGYLAPKFVTGGAPAPYPTAASAPTRAATIRMIEPVQLASAHDLATLFTLLTMGGAAAFVAKIIAIIGPSLDFCHVIMSNPAVIKMAPIAPFHASAFYALRVLYLEELSMYARKRGAGRFILDLDAVAAMPAYDGFVEHSPYFSLVAAASGDISKMALPSRMTGRRGAYTTAEFVHRMAVFTGGALKYLQWSGDGNLLPAHKTALTGSTITACALRTPLEHDTAAYFAEYYPARTDMQVQKQVIRASIIAYDSSSEDAGDETAEDVDTAEDTIGDSDQYYIRGGRSKMSRTMAPLRPARTMPARTKPKKTMPAKTMAPANDVITHDIDYTDIDLMVECEWEHFDAVALAHFKAIERACPRVCLERVVTENKHKYTVTGLPRTIDIFHVVSIPEVMVKYHLGCVRAWYDGSRVHCLPSFVTAAHTGMNMDIRWSSNRKDVRDIVMKYFQRGFGTALTHSDRADLVNYVNGGTLWPHVTPPGNHWRARHYHREPLFHDSLPALYNPSVSRLGIHAAIATPPARATVPLVLDRSQAAKGKLPGWMGRNRVIIAPNVCTNLITHM